MNDAIGFAVMLGLSLSFATALIYAGVRLIRSAKKGGKGIQAAGMMFFLLGFGNVRDPNHQAVHRMEQVGRKREEDHNGDPPNETPLT